MAATPASAKQDDERMVATLDRTFQAAVKWNDAEAMARILHADFILVVGNGTLVSRTELLDEAREAVNVYQHQDEEPGSQTVRVFGDTAVVTAKLWIKGRASGRDFDRKLWFSDTYVRTSDGWRYAFAQASSPLPDPVPSESVEAASHAFDDAQYRQDATLLDQMLPADFHIVHGSGEIGDKRDFIAGFTDPQVRFEPFEIRDRIVKMLGHDAALITAEGTIKGTKNGKPFVDRFRFVDTFRRRGSGWEVAYVQVTPLPPDKGQLIRRLRDGSAKTRKWVACGPMDVTTLPIASKAPRDCTPSSDLTR